MFVQAHQADSEANDVDLLEDNGRLAPGNIQSSILSQNDADLVYDYLQEMQGSAPETDEEALGNLHHLLKVGGERLKEAAELCKEMKVYSVLA